MRKKPAKSTQRSWFHVSILHKRLQNINLRTHQIISDVALASRGNSQYFKASGVASRYLDNRYSGQIHLSNVLDTDDRATRNFKNKVGHMRKDTNPIPSTKM